MNNIQQMINLAVETLTVDEQLDVLQYITSKLKAENIKSAIPATTAIRTAHKLAPLTVKLNAIQEDEYQLN